MDSKSHEILKKEYLKIIGNQLKLNDPPEVKATFKRLCKSGIKKERVKLMLADCMQIEMMTMMKEGREFDIKTYSKLLNTLPGNPFEV